MYLSEKDCTKVYKWCSFRKVIFDIQRQIIYISLWQGSLAVKWIEDSQRNQSTELQCRSIEGFITSFCWKELLNRLGFVPVDTELKLRVHRMFRWCTKHHGCLLNVLCVTNLKAIFTEHSSGNMVWIGHR